MDLGFNRITLKVAQSLIHMDSAIEMRALKEFLVNLLDETKTAMLRAEGNNLIRLQGQAVILEEFVTAIKTAAATAEKLRPN